MHQRFSLGSLLLITLTAITSPAQEKRNSGEKPFFEVIQKLKPLGNGVAVTHTLINSTGRTIKGCEIEVFGGDPAFSSKTEVQEFPAGTNRRAKRITIPGMHQFSGKQLQPIQSRVAYVRFEDGSEWRNAALSGQ